MLYEIIDDKLYLMDYTGIGWNEKKGGKLYKINLDGSNPHLLCDYNMAYVIIRNNWIYFKNSDDKQQYYKMDLDGNNITRLTYESTWHVIIEDNN